MTAVQRAPQVTTEARLDDAVDFLEAQDPLGRDIPLRHVLDATVLGIPVRFESNSGFVINVATEAFGRAARDVAPDTIAIEGAAGAQRAPLQSRGSASTIRTPITVRVVVHTGNPDRDGDMSPVRAWAPEKTWVILQAPDTVAVADALRGQAVAYVPRTLVARRAQFRHAVLETLTLVLVSHHDRQPVHAAAVGRDGAVVLLCAASGIGKSTLAYAAHLAGLTVFSDDVTWVQLQPRVVVWGGGLPRRIHLMPDARERFPSLASATPTALPSGKCKIVVDLGAPARGESLIADRITVCLIERTTGATVASRVSATAVVAALTASPEPGFDRYLERLGACARALGAGGGWRLAVSDDPATAVPHLRAMLDGAGGAR
jgi:hypothetical protein